MKKTPEQQIPQTPERLAFQQPEGWYKYGKIPYKIYYTLECPTADLPINEKDPGKAMLTPDIGGGMSLSIFVHESVPSEYKDIVAFHELKESELRFADDMDIDQAHQQAVIETDKYARGHLTSEEFEEFVDWQKTLDNTLIKE